MLEFTLKQQGKIKRLTNKTFQLDQRYKDGFFSAAYFLKTEEIIKKSFSILFFRLFLHILLYPCIIYLKVLKTYVFQVFGNYSKYRIFSISSKCCPLSFLG